MKIYPEALQAAFSMVCGWLLGADAQSFNCDHFTELLKSLPKFAHLPVACRKRVIKMDKGESIHPGEGTQGIVILCNADYLTETNIAMKATFNRSTPQAIAERPDGYNFKYIEYFAEAKSKTATHKQLKTTIKAKFKQNKFYDNIRRIRISGIHCLDYAIDIPNPDSTQKNPLPDRPTTCRQMISSLKCQDNYEYQLINQIHEQHDNSIIGVCHRDQYREAAIVLGHLPVILNERYGSRTEAWFTQKAIDAAKAYSFCNITGQIINEDDEEEDDLFLGFCSDISPALAANARAKGETIEEEYDGNLDDIDVEDAEEQPIKLDMNIMFNNSALGEGGGYDDAQSVGTMMTGTSKATAILNQIGGALTVTEDEVSIITSSDTPSGTTTNTAATAASMQQTGVNDDNQ
jgi:hypothetical protein